MSGRPSGPSARAALRARGASCGSCRSTGALSSTHNRYAVDIYTHLALDMGFSTFVLIADPDAETLRTFIEEVAPQVRDRVAEARAGLGSG